jgi:signal transduction histidine kinase
LQGLAGPLNDEQAKQLGMVRTSARHLLALISDVLDISKIEAGQLHVTFKPFNIPPVIEQVIRAVSPMAEKKELALVADIAPEVSQMVSDQRRVEQILLNLVNNAVKFTEEGQVTLRVKPLADGEKAGSYPPAAIRFEVEDTGIGIKPEDMKILFQPFRQIDTGLGRRHEGTGLGLSICKKLAELLGGEIWAESEWGQGSRFIFILPVGKT